MNLSRMSVIEGHHRDVNTDSLYDPLRKTLLVDTTAKKSLLQQVTQVSHVSHVAKTHTYAENYQIGHSIFIPEQAKLRPSHDLSKIPTNRRYQIVNAQKRMLDPISAEQLQKRTKNKEQIIVYTYGTQQTPLQTPKARAPNKLRTSGIKITQPKYNLFSVLDQPINNIFSGGPCTCPANEIVAGQRNQLRWDDVKKHNDGDDN